MAKHPRTRTRPVRPRKVAKPSKAAKAVKSPKPKHVMVLPGLTKRDELRLAPEPNQVNHLNAVAIYERGVGALQLRKFAEAATLLQTVIDSYPDEKELHERARLYLNICQRQTVPPDSSPRTLEERLYAATLAINRGAYGDGARQLQALAGEIPDHDHVQYMLAVAYAQLGEAERAWPHLARAIELNAENRFLARHDADLEPIRRDPQFRRVVDRMPARRERRTPHRARIAR